MDGDDKRSNRSPVNTRTQQYVRSRRTIKWSIATSVVAAAVLVGGFVYGTYAALGGSPGGTTPPAASDGPTTTAQPVSSKTHTLHLVALGDSLTHGLGDASGRGYVGDVSTQYRNQGYTVIESNLGIDGLTSTGLIANMKQVSTQNLLKSADVILVSIGGNDLNGAAGLPNIHPDRIAKAKDTFSSNLTTILSTIHDLNQHATVALIGLYNPYGDSPATRRQTDAIIQTWDAQEDAVTAAFPRTLVVQTFDLFQLHPASFLYIDHFHPNQTGYQRIADRVWQDLQMS